MRRSRLWAVLVFTLASAVASAEVYKWFDAEGKVHYGDRPPGTASDPQSLTLPPAPTKDADHAERSLLQRRLLQAIDAERAERDQAAAEATAARRERTLRCEKARRDLARFERANIIYTDDENGTRVYMSDDERREATGNARRWIDKHCN